MLSVGLFCFVFQMSDREKDRSRRRSRRSRSSSPNRYACDARYASRRHRSPSRRHRDAYHTSHPRNTRDASRQEYSPEDRRRRRYSPGRHHSPYYNTYEQGSSSGHRRQSPEGTRFRRGLRSRSPSRLNKASNHPDFPSYPGTTEAEDGKVIASLKLMEDHIDLEVIKYSVGA